MYCVENKFMILFVSTFHDIFYMQIINPIKLEF